MEWLPLAIELLRIALELVGAAALLATQVRTFSDNPNSQKIRDALHFLAANRREAANR